MDGENVTEPNQSAAAVPETTQALPQFPQDGAASNSTNNTQSDFKSESLEQGSKPKKQRSEKQIAATQRMLDAQKMKREQGLPVGRKPKQRPTEYSDMDRKYNTELLYEFEKSRKDEAKKKRTADAFEAEFTKFEQKMNEKIVNQLQNLFEEPLKKYFSVSDDEDEEEKPRVSKKSRSEPSTESTESTESTKKTTYGSFFPLSRDTRTAAAGAESQRKNRRSFYS